MVTSDVSIMTDHRPFPLTLWSTNKIMENHNFELVTHYRRPFSIVMLNYLRVLMSDLFGMVNHIIRCLGRSHRDTTVVLNYPESMGIPIYALLLFVDDVLIVYQDPNIVNRLYKVMQQFVS